MQAEARMPQLCTRSASAVFGRALQTPAGSMQRKGYYLNVYFLAPLVVFGLALNVCMKETFAFGPSSLVYFL
jgi:hypothetical protein